MAAYDLRGAGNILTSHIGQRVTHLLVNVCSLDGAFGGSRHGWFRYVSVSVYVWPVSGPGLTKK